MTGNDLLSQIEGGFIQGYGLFVLEDYRVSPSGQLLTIGPGFYKIPSFGDIPAEFNVSLLTRAPNPFAICSSKASLMAPIFGLTTIIDRLRDQCLQGCHPVTYSRTYIVSILHCLHWCLPLTLALYPFLWFLAGCWRTTPVPLSFCLLRY